MAAIQRLQNDVFDFEEYYYMLNPGAEDMVGLVDEEVKKHDDFVQRLKAWIQSFGIEATEDSIISYGRNNELSGFLQSLVSIAGVVAEMEDSKIEDFDYILDMRDKYQRKLWQDVFAGRGRIDDDTYIQSFYDSSSGKTKYSYSADNHLMRMFRGICMGSLKEFLYNLLINITFKILSIH